jgi:hypothetical protein
MIETSEFIMSFLASTFYPEYARVAELVDARDLKSLEK